MQIRHSDKEKRSSAALNISERETKPSLLSSFTDNRPETLVQRRLKAIAQNSSINKPNQFPLQMVAWDPASTVAAGALSAPLAAAYALAQANPAAKPAQPAWVTARAQAADPWNAVAERAVSDAHAITKWGELNAVAQGHIQASPAGEAGWKTAKSDAHYNLRMGSKQNQWPITAAAKWGAAEAKWADPWTNKDGDLPGVANAGGYAEYYAEPSGVVAVEGFWGRNRIVHDTTGAGTYANNWWATDDHYTTFNRIT